MSYIDEIFTRLDVQHIREFLLHGTEECKISKQSYYERLRTAEKAANSFLRSFYSSDDEYEQSTMPVFNYVSATQEVYMEIGLQCGLLLATQINRNTQTDNER